MAYEVLRVEKLKNLGNVASSAAHLLREREEPHLNKEQTKLNRYFGPETSQAVLEKAQERLSRLKVQKHCVHALEYVISYGEGAFAKPGDDDKYFGQAKRWLNEKHGAENVISFVVHRDEQTPHVHAIVIPVRKLDSGQEILSAAHYVNGSKKLSDLQTEFHEKVGKDHGLKRGVEGSKALHQDVKRYRTLVRNAYKLGNEYQKSARTIPPFQGEPGLRILTAEGRELWQKEVHAHYEKHFARLTDLIEKTYVTVNAAEAKMSGHKSLETKLKQEQQTIQKLKKELTGEREAGRSNLQFLRDLTKAVRSGNMEKAGKMMTLVEDHEKKEIQVRAAEAAIDLETGKNLERDDFSPHR